MEYLHRSMSPHCPPCTIKQTCPSGPKGSGSRHAVCLHNVSVRWNLYGLLLVEYCCHCALNMALNTTALNTALSSHTCAALLQNLELPGIKAAYCRRRGAL